MALERAAVALEKIAAALTDSEGEWAMMTIAEAAERAYPPPPEPAKPQPDPPEPPA